MERSKYVILFVVLSLSFFVFDYHNILQKHPQTVHQWRQCDGGAIAMHYVHNKLNPFDPGVYNLHGNGKTVAEFPIIYYVDACIISIVGYHYRDVVIRMVNLLIFYLGLLYLFKIGLLVLKRWYWALLPVLFYAACPIVTYYAATSVPNVPASAILCIGIFYLLNYLQQKETKPLFLAIFFVAIAGMIKSTVLTPYLAICGVLFFAL